MKSLLYLVAFLRLCSCDAGRHVSSVRSFLPRAAPPFILYCIRFVLSDLGGLHLALCRFLLRFLPIRNEDLLALVETALPCWTPSVTTHGLRIGYKPVARRLHTNTRRLYTNRLRKDRVVKRSGTVPREISCFFVRENEAYWFIFGALVWELALMVAMV